MGGEHAELTFETDTVALQAVHGLPEEVLSSGGHSGDIVLFPLNGSVDVFEDLLDGVGNFSPDTVTRNQGHLRHIEPSVSPCGTNADRHSRYKHLRTWLEAIHKRQNQVCAVSEWSQVVLCVSPAGNQQRGSLQISETSIHSGMIF